MLSGAALYAVGYDAYLVMVQLVAMGLANRRLDPEAFGGFAVLYSLTMFFAALASRWLQHLAIRAYPGGDGPAEAYWAWFRAAWLRGAAGVAVGAGVAAWALGDAVGIGAAASGVEAGTTAAFLAFSHVLFEGLVGTAARIRRSFGGLSAAFVGYAVVGGSLAWFARTPGGFMMALGAGGLGVAVIYAALERHRVTSANRAGVPAGPRPAREGPSLLAPLSRRVALFAVMSLAIRYLDRVLVGHFLGSGAAGTYFALNAGVMAILLPAGIAGPLLHGWIARWTELPRSGMRAVALAVLAVPLALLLVSPLARLVVTWVYPNVALPPVALPWLAFCAGRILLASRDLSEPIISRFGSVTSLPLVDGALLGLLALAMLLADARLDLDAANLLSGVSLGVAGLFGLLVLAQTARGRATAGGHRGVAPS